MNHKHMILAAWCALVAGLTLHTQTFAMHQMGSGHMGSGMMMQGKPRNMMPSKWDMKWMMQWDMKAHHDAIQKAIETNDFAAFVAAHPEDMRANITEDMFAKAKEMFPKMEILRKFHEKYADVMKNVDHEKVKNAIEANDYNSFVAAHPEAMRADITQELFTLMKEHKPMMREMKQEKREMKKKMRQEGKQTKQWANKVDRKAMITAIEANNYEAFVATLPEQLKDFVTPEVFAKIVEKYNAKKAQ